MKCVLLDSSAVRHQCSKSKVPSAPQASVTHHAAYGRCTEVIRVLQGVAEPPCLCGGWKCTESVLGSGGVGAMLLPLCARFWLVWAAWLTAYL